MKKSNVLLFYPNIVPGSPVSPLWHLFRCRHLSLSLSLQHVFYIISENRQELHPYTCPMYKEIKSCSCLPSVGPTLPFLKQDHKHKHGWRWLWQRHMFRSHIFIKEEQSKYTSDLWADAWLFRTQNKLSNSTGEDWNKTMTLDSLLAHQ